MLRSLPLAAAIALGTVLGATLAPALAYAGEADVLRATASPEGGGSYRISATIRHNDTGWDHYADGFDVLTLDGVVLKTRTLFHPHEAEQPFTRSLSGVVVPDAETAVIVHAHDKAHGYGGKEFRLKLPR